jgi:benzoyl-CoA reductase subunit BamC
MAKVKKLVKTIRVDADRCNGCRGCEIACSAFHAEPKFSSINPARSRIRVLTHRLKDIWLPVFAGEYTPTECAGREVYTIDGKEYEECAFCRAACPSRDWFKEPDTGLPMRCDMCEGEEEPWCVKWCLTDVLVFEEREEWVEEESVEQQQELLDTGLESLADKYGLQKLREAMDRLNIKGS